MKSDNEKAKDAPKKPAGKVFDVRRPGKALASPTSRPVIVGHKPEAQQAQIAVSGVGESPLLGRRKVQISPANQAESEPKPGKSPDFNSFTSKEIAPAEAEVESLATVALEGVVGPPVLPKELDKADQAPAPTAELEPQTVDTSADATKTESDNIPTLEPEKPEPPVMAEEMPQDSTSVPETDDAEVSPSKQEAPPAPEPKIEPLFDESGAIIVSHHGHYHRHHGLKVFALILLILILAAIGIDILLDLGILTLPGVPHTDYL